MQRPKRGYLTGGLVHGAGRWDWQLSLAINRPHATKQNAMDELLRLQRAYAGNEYRAKEYVRR